MQTFLAFFIISMLVLGIFLTSRQGRSKVAGKIILNVLAALLLGVVLLFAVLVLSFSTVDAIFYSVFATIVAVLVLIAVSGAMWHFIRKKYIYLPLIAAAVLLAAVTGGYSIVADIRNGIETVSEGDDILYRYTPYGENSKVVVLPEESTLKMEGDLPLLDGATALYPVYSAFARAVYPQGEIEDSPSYVSKVACTTTSGAYERLISGERDMIFVASASENQRLAAAEQGVELEFTPIGREAFVFFVNSNNPIEDITIEEIRGIYSGSITEWSELGIEGLGGIRPFQRDEGSGSQTALQGLMAGTELMEPPTENVMGTMGGIIEKNADYRNYKDAIGYSFGFYSTEMVENNQIKLLSVNGIYPEKESIADGSYPLSGEFYAVTTQNSNPRCEELLQWILSEQGQQIIDETGYVAIN